MKIAFQNTFGILKILKIDWATSILMRGHGEILIDLLVNKLSIIHSTSYMNCHIFANFHILLYSFHQFIAMGIWKCSLEELILGEKQENSSESLFSLPFWGIPVGWNDFCNVAILLTRYSNFRLNSKFYCLAYWQRYK